MAQREWFRGADLPGLSVWWQDRDGNLIDFSAASFELRIGPRGGAPLLVKTTGITGSVGSGSEGNGTPNVFVSWVDGDLDFAAGIYTVTIVATFAGRDRIMATTIRVLEPIHAPLAVTAAGTWGTLATTGTATVTVTSIADGTWGTLVATAVAAGNVIGAVAQSWGTLTATAAGVVSEIISGAVAQSWGALTATVAGVRKVRGAVAQSLGALTATAVGVRKVQGSVSSSLGGLTGAGDAGGVAYNQAVDHGEELTINDVGPWALQGVPKGSEVLTELDHDGERVSTWPGEGRPSWIPGTDYVYNNSTSNHGGVVPTGGLTIDGWFVPAGTWVVQFREFTNGNPVIVSGDNSGDSAAWPGVMFRGCRFRGNTSAPGFISNNAQSTGGITWINYCDAGGIDVVSPNICESIFESQGNDPSRDRQYIIRCFLSIASTLAFGRNDGDAFVENIGQDVVRYFGDDTYHMNGLANSGGQAGTLWLRNRLDFSPHPQPGPSNNPFPKSQNDVVQMAADGGAYPGTAINLDGSQGYCITDNYLAGADHTLQLGVDKGNTSADVSNVKVTGNRFSTYWYFDSGETSLSYKNPTWGVQGNEWSGNTWVDDYGTGSWDEDDENTLRQYPAGNGPRVGTTVSAPTNP